MPKREDLTGADRQADYRRNRRNAGWIEYRRWLPPDVAEKVRNYAAELLSQPDGLTAPGQIETTPAALVDTPQARPVVQAVADEIVAITFPKPPGDRLAGELRFADFQKQGSGLVWVSRPAPPGMRDGLRRRVETQGGKWKVSVPVDEPEDEEWL